MDGCIGSLSQIRIPLDLKVLDLLPFKNQLVNVWLTRWPIWAFLAGRSAQDAIRRAIAHCQCVQQRLLEQRPSVHQRARQETLLPVSGGIQVFLDLEKAFDGVNRDVLFQRMHLLGVPPEIVIPLTEWHSDTGYFLSRQHCQHRIPVGTGVRQGCKAAPLLWNLLIGILFTDLSTVIDSEWLRKTKTSYADDFHFASEITCKADVLAFLSKLGTILDHMERLGLRLNPAKTEVLLRLTGSAHRKLLAQTTTRTPHGCWLRVPRANGKYTDLKIVDAVTYLGVRISYRN